MLRLPQWQSVFGEGKEGCRVTRGGGGERRKCWEERGEGMGMLRVKGEGEL